MMNKELERSVRQVVDHLVAGRYSDLEVLTKGRRLSAKDMARTINDYGRTLALPPKEAFEIIDIVRVLGTEVPQWSITMPLWTCEEGRSDLSLELTLTAQSGGYEIELDDIHVL
jgi:hypothetical protein